MFQLFEISYKYSLTILKCYLLPLNFKLFFFSRSDNETEWKVKSDKNVNFVKLVFVPVRKTVFITWLLVVHCGLPA